MPINCSKLAFLYLCCLYVYTRLIDDGSEFWHWLFSRSTTIGVLVWTIIWWAPTVLLAILLSRYFSRQIKLTVLRESIAILLPVTISFIAHRLQICFRYDTLVPVSWVDHASFHFEVAQPLTIYTFIAGATVAICCFYRIVFQDNSLSSDAFGHYPKSEDCH